MVTVRKFEAWFIGTKTESYCSGLVKVTATAVQKAARDYSDGSVCILPAVDTYAAANFTSAPVPFRIDLAASAVLQKNEGDEEMPRTPVPLPKQLASALAT